MKTVISFFVIDKAQLIEEWGSKFSPAHKEPNFIHSCLPSVPIMALSATAPRRLIAGMSHVCRFVVRVQDLKECDPEVVK